VLKERPHLPVEYGFFGFSAPKYSIGLNSLFVAKAVEEIYAVAGHVVCCDNTRKKRHFLPV